MFQIKFLSELCCSTCGLFLDIVAVERKVRYTLLKGNKYYETMVKANKFDTGSFSCHVGLKRRNFLSAVSFLYLLCNSVSDFHIIGQLKYQKKCRVYNAYFSHINI